MKTVIVEDGSHCIDIEVANQVAAWFIALILGVQLGKPAAEIALIRGR